MSTTRIDRSRPGSKCIVRRYMIRMLHIRLEHECARRIRLKGIGCCFLCCFCVVLCRFCAVLRFRTLSCPSSRGPRGPEATALFLNFRYYIRTIRGLRRFGVDFGVDFGKNHMGSWTRVDYFHEHKPPIRTMRDFGENSGFRGCVFGLDSDKNYISSWHKGCCC